jgi:hypothetical protein
LDCAGSAAAAALWNHPIPWPALPHRQNKAVQVVTEEHNFKIEALWLTGGGDSARCCWWHVTEITLDHLRSSREWKAKMDELRLAKNAKRQSASD